MSAALAPELVIRNATDMAGVRIDIRVCSGRISHLGKSDKLPLGARVVDAQGRALLPGLHDHHLHLCAAAVAYDTVDCGPPTVNNEQDLAAQLRKACPDANGWIRGRGYDAGIAGDLDRVALDKMVPDIPLRIQHASGRLWICNSAAIARLGAGPWEQAHGKITGRLFDADAWMRTRLDSQFPNLSRLSDQLARFGIVGVTDTSPKNNAETAAHFRVAIQRGEFKPQILMMGDESLHEPYAAQTANAWPADLRLGAYKIHLLESALPEFDVLCEGIRASHDYSRPVAFHCVTRAELVFALAALQAAGAIAGDRIEHAGVCPEELWNQMRELQLCVVTQPIFIHDRGDRYLRDVAQEDQRHLYRLQALMDAGIPIAASSDAPYGNISPWHGMQAAVHRRTRGGIVMGWDEAASPEQAWLLYTGNLLTPTRAIAELADGMTADICLLDRDWRAARSNLSEVQVLMTARAGQLTWQSPSLGSA